MVATLFVRADLDLSSQREVLLIRLRTLGHRARGHRRTLANRRKAVLRESIVPVPER